MLTAVLIIIIVGAIGSVFIAAIAGAGAVASMASDEKHREDAESRKDEILRELFDGRDQVSYKTHRGLSEATLLAGASDHGYTLTTVSGEMALRTHYFKRDGE